MSVRVRVRSPLGELARQVADAAADLGRRYTLGLVLSDAPREPYPTVRGKPRQEPARTNGEVLSLLAETQGLTEVDVQARGRIVREVLATLPRRNGLPTASQLWLAIGGRWRALVIERVERGGGDLSPSANTSDWTRYKGRLGLSTQKFRASGQLLAALRSSTVEIRGR